MSSNQGYVPYGTDAVYTGFWINQDRGRILGATLTLPDKQAAPLLAALAVLVALAGNRSWHLCRLIWHRFLRAKEAHTSAIKIRRRKQQVVIRNCETAGGATLGLFAVWFNFGVLRILREFSPKDIVLGLFTLGHWISFIALGVLVSQIVVGNLVVSKVLPTCGLWVPIASDPPTTESNAIFNEMKTNETINAENYVRSCYPKGGSQGIIACDKFITRSFQQQTIEGQACPFKGVCLPNANSAVTFDSGNMTFSELGLNTRFYSVSDKSDDDTGENETLPFNNANSMSYNYRLLSAYLPYQLEKFPPALQVEENNNELSIFYMQDMGILFIEPEKDPWFSANIANEFPQLTKPGDPVFTRYSADRWLNIVLCHEQYRFCSTITENCTDFRGLISRNKSSNQEDYNALLGSGTKPKVTTGSDWAFSIILFEEFMQKTPLAFSIAGSSDLALQANRLLNDGHQSKLSDRQWILEFEFWFTMALARLQLGIFNTIERPLGLDDTRTFNFFAVEGREAIYNLCGRIKFNDPNHTSLSTFGLILILVFSLFLMFASLMGTLLPLIPFVKRWRPLVEWERDDALALLASDYEWVESFHVAFDRKASPSQNIHNDSVGERDPFQMDY
ncbi:hypothetical protein BKA65DRAFT_479680 [Rhexocercosporidium sp. MPI-PUGE-AT-0058]|nr:hypothetical protein BKA65DRAFT_479680 [Rhexocercosporidium sp. MPI-PUGE-AT-0058]